MSPYCDCTQAAFQPPRRATRLHLSRHTLAQIRRRFSPITHSCCCNAAPVPAVCGVE
uniref:Uncharacterized protein n=1 Tax=Arundo donax TaxID=35708 RepID=A0A0A9FLU5_ARUDO